MKRSQSCNIVLILLTSKVILEVFLYCKKRAHRLFGYLTNKHTREDFEDSIGEADD